MTPSATESRRPLDMKTKLFYGLGALSFGVKDNGFSYLLLLFYNQVVGLPATNVGLALMIALLIDACIDPVIGEVSDNLRSRWGRRHPFMYAAALPIALAYAAVWNPPHWSAPALFGYLVVCAVGVRALVSLYEVPSSALAAELTDQYDERSVLLSYRMFFAWIGGLSIQLLAFTVLLRPDATHAVGQLNPAGYARYGLIAALVMFIAMLTSAIGTHHCIPMLKTPPPPRRLTVMQALAEARETLSNRSFMFLMASTLASALIIGVAASLNQYFNTYFWGLSAHQIAGLTAGVFLSAFIALFAGPRIARRLGKRTTTMALLVAAVGVGLAPILLRLAGVMPPNHTAALYAIIFAVSVIGVTFGIVSLTMGGAMIADVVEVAELKTGRRSEGLFFAASTFVNKAVSGLGVLGASILIQAIGLKSGADPATVPPAVLRHLALLYCPLALVLYATAFTLLFGYKITRASHQDTLQRLADR